MKKIQISIVLLILTLGIASSTIAATATEPATEVIRDKVNQYYFKIHGKPYNTAGQPNLADIEYTFKNLATANRRIEIWLYNHETGAVLVSGLYKDVLAGDTWTPTTTISLTGALVDFTVYIPNLEPISDTIWVPPNNP